MILTRIERPSSSRPCRAIIPSRLAPGLAATVVLLGLTACSTLPSSGPTAKAFVRESKHQAPAFRIVDIQALLAHPEHSVGTVTLSISELAKQPLPFPRPDTIQPGDVLQITVYEIGAALFGANSVPQTIGQVVTSAPAPAANSQTLPLLTVPPDGVINLPYVGRVAAAGLSPGELETAIEMGLHGKSQSPQVVVSVREDVGNTVILMGDVKSPGRKLLSYDRERLLDMIAIAGGTGSQPQDSSVRMTRAGVTAEAALDLIRTGSPDDIVLQPHDRVEIVRDGRSFTAFGASGRVSEVPFQKTRLSLAEALARIGGPLDQLADPRGVFIFRAGQDPTREPVLYRLDLGDPKSYFAAQSFMMQDKDLIFIANAGANMWSKLLGMVNSVVTPIVTGRQLSP